MNKPQIQSILDNIKQIEEQNIEEIIVSLYPNFNEVIIGDYYAAELISTINRIIKQLKAELESDNSRHLPNLFSSQEQGASDLYSQVNSVYSNLINKTVQNIPPIVNWLVAYQIGMGFWDKSAVKIHSVDALKIEDAQIKINLLKEELENSLKLSKDSIAQLLVEKENLTTFVVTKDGELKSITTLLQTAQNQTTEITGLLTTSVANNEKINSVLTQQTDKLKEIQTKFDDDKKDYDKTRIELDAYGKSLSERIAELQKASEQFDIKLKFIESKEGYIIQKEKEINDLTGFAGGVSLFHTFQERKKELDKPVKNWFWGLIWSAILTVVGVGLIFLVSPAGDNWNQFALNTLKSAPFFILLYFSIRQYSKERAIQEEYAFKSAVALTLNAFADKLSATGDTGKDKLIISSVDKIYDIPNVMKEKSGSILSFRTKALNETIKTLSNAVNEVKGK